MTPPSDRPPPPGSGRQGHQDVQDAVRERRFITAVSAFRATLLVILLLPGLGLGLLVDASGGASAAATGAAGWTWPLTPRPEVERDFRPPAREWLSGHRGVDLDAEAGARVRSPAAGTVTFVGVVVDRPVVTVDHGGGRLSSFEPVRAAVRRGDRVAKGQVIGTLTTSGHCRSDGCLHWGVREDGQYVNPLKFVQDLRPSVLLPLP